VAIASNDGGKQALEAVRTQLPALREPPFGLTTEQVVAIASNDGGKQALEAVRTQLPALREPPYGLTTEQVVNMACVVGRPALEAILAYLPAL
ncbi:avirulence protein, partial [Paraburkholderia sp. BR14427]